MYRFGFRPDECPKCGIKPFLARVYYRSDELKGGDKPKYYNERLEVECLNCGWQYHTETKEKG